MELLDNGAVALSQPELDGMLEYSASLPTGTTAGKEWKRRVPPWAPKDRAEWWRGVYGTPYPADHQHADQVPIGWRRIVVKGRPPFFPLDVTVPPPPMRGRIQIGER